MLGRRACRALTASFARTKSGALAWLAGFSLGAVVAGASRELTAMPALITGAFGGVGMWLAWLHAPRRSTVLLFACGALAGSLLPRGVTAPATVTTHSMQAGQRGDLFHVLDEVDADPWAVLGHRVTVSGEWAPADSARAATVSRRIMTCCAADAVRVGFDVSPKTRVVGFARGAPVRVSGFLAASVRGGDVRYVIRDAIVELATSGFAAGVRPSARSSPVWEASHRGRDGGCAESGFRARSGRTRTTAVHGARRMGMRDGCCASPRRTSVWPPTSNWWTGRRCGTNGSRNDARRCSQTR